MKKTAQTTVETTTAVEGPSFAVPSAHSIPSASSILATKRRAA